MIENMPDRRITGTPSCDIYPHLDPEGFVKGKELWIQQVNKSAESPAILGNAADYFLLHDPAMAEDLLKRAKAAAPTDPQWPEELGHLYNLNRQSTNPQDAQNAVAKALTEYEAAMALMDDQTDRFYLLKSLARSALAAGQIDKAKAYAQQNLDLAAQFRDDWNYGNAIHYGNIVFGQIALMQNDVATAKEYLIAAGKTPGSPQLNSFGPNMDLAKALLERDEKAVVLEYLDLCAKFWDMGAQTLQEWRGVIEQGSVPDFGPHLDD